MKDGARISRTRRSIDLETSAIVAVTVQGANQGDTTTIDQTLSETVEQLIAVDRATTRPIAIADEIVADKGDHSRAKLRELKDVGFRTYISEPDRPPQGWVDQHAERAAVYANRGRIHGERGQRLLRKQGEVLERMRTCTRQAACDASICAVTRIF
jgi:transposase